MPARIPTERLLFELQRVQNIAGRAPSPNDFEQYSEFNKSVITKRFASWNDARWAAGIVQEVSSAERKRASEDELFQDIRILARGLGKVPSAQDMEEHGPRSSTTYQRRFGSWESAREKAGFPEENRFKIQSDVLLKHLREFADEIEKVPSQMEMKRCGPHSAQVYANRFGSYAEGVRAAGLEPNTTATSPSKGPRMSWYGPLWEKQRREALSRDDFECQDCGMNQETHLEKRGCALHVHHKTPLREFEDRGEAHALENLITLCGRCHPKHETSFDSGEQA